MSKTFEINPERSAYLDARGKVILKACPGSGKTTSVAYKLKKLIDEVESSSGNHYRGIACLSFTNVAKDEINSKFKDFHGKFISFPHAVLTIDSFINQYIVLPYFHHLKPSVTRPKILDSNFGLNNYNLGFLNSIRIDNVPISKRYPPEYISINLSNQFLFKKSRPNLTGEDLKSFNAYCQRLKAWQFNNGVLTQNDSIYAAFKILESQQRIAEYLSKRFPLIVIDEAQDTSEIQFAIIDQLIDNGLSQIELIGDPFQSLYEWRNARPDLFEDRFNDSTTWNAKTLMQCRRSQQKIINQYSQLRNDNVSIVTSSNIQDADTLVIRFHEGDEKSAVAKYIELSSQYKIRHVAVRGNSLRRKILNQPERQPEPWKSKTPYTILYALEQIELGNIKKAVSSIRSFIPRLIQPSITLEEERKQIESLKNDFSVNAKLFGLLKALPSLDLSLTDWTSQTQLKLQECFELLETPDFELKQGVWRPKHVLSLKSVMLIETDSCEIPVSTIHKIKGKTLESLLLILSRSSISANISLNELTHSTDFPNEKKRMLYIAMSRPSHQLVIAVPSNFSREDISSKLGGEVIFYEV